MLITIIRNKKSLADLSLKQRMEIIDSQIQKLQDIFLANKSQRENIPYECLHLRKIVQMRICNPKTTINTTLFLYRRNLSVLSDVFMYYPLV